MNDKYLVQLSDRVTGRRAVVVDWNPKEARFRALMNDPKGPWQDCECHIICRVRHTMTNLVLAMEQ
jgi:hypothetical protein